MLIRTPRQPVIVSTSLGFDMIVDPKPHQEVERAIFYHGIYEAETLQFMGSVLRPGDVFVDIGANIGLMSLAASGMVGEKGAVYAFEPAQDSYSVLVRNVGLNRAANIVCRTEAIGASRGAGIIFEPSLGRGHATMVQTQQRGAARQSIRIETLDGFLKDSGIHQVRAIKIDVEGWEFEALRGAKNLLAADGAPIVIIEFNTGIPLQGGSHAEMYRFLTTINNYQVYRLRRGKEAISTLVRVQSAGELPKQDNMFCLLPSHLTDAGLA